MEIEGRSRKNMDVSGRGPKSFIFYTMEIEAAFIKGGILTRFVYTSFLSQCQHNTKYCALGFRVSNKT